MSATNNQGSKLILASGTDNGIGTTSIMNYVALELAKNSTVLLIEFKKKTGFTTYMQRGLHERRKSLTEVMGIPERLPDNVIRSPHNGNMFYLCMNMYENCLMLQEYQSFKIIDIVSNAKKIFDYVILDLPPDPSEPAVGVAYGKDFPYEIDHTLLFLDERVSSYKYLNDFNAILSVAGEVKRDVTFVMNKVSTAHYHEYIEDYLPSLPLTVVKNKVWIPYLEDLIVATNSGRIYNTGVTKESKFFFKQIRLITDIIEGKVEDGIGLEPQNIDKPKKGFLGLFKKKPTEKKKKKLKKNEVMNQDLQDELLQSEEDFKEYHYVEEDVEEKPKTRKKTRKKTSKKKTGRRF